MGIEYTPIAGFGIKVEKEEVFEKFQLQRLDKDGDDIGIIEAFESSYYTKIAEVKKYGSNLSGKIEYVLLMRLPEKILPDEISYLLKKFIEFLDKFGFTYKLEFIQEVLEW